MEDYLLKTLAYDGQLRIYAAKTTNLVQEAQRLHDTWSTATAAFGRTLTGTALLSAALLKGSGKLTVRVQGDGPVGAIIADGDANGQVKGYLHHPHVELALNSQHKIDVKGAVGKKGFLTITKDLGLKTPFTGQVPLVSGELGEDFTYYLAKSEQIPSAVGVSVFVEPDQSVITAGGFLVQVLPGATEKNLVEMENTLKKMPSISEIMARDQHPETLIKYLSAETKVKELEKVQLKYFCDCSKERFAKALASIASADLQKLIEDDRQAEAVCQFCGKKYRFNKTELQKLQAKNS